MKYLLIFIFLSGCNDGIKSRKLENSTLGIKNAVVDKIILEEGNCTVKIAQFFLNNRDSFLFYQGKANGLHIAYDIVYHDTALSNQITKEIIDAQ